MSIPVNEESPDDCMAAAIDAMTDLYCIKSPTGGDDCAWCGSFCLSNHTDPRSHDKDCRWVKTYQVLERAFDVVAAFSKAGPLPKVIEGELTPEIKEWAESIFEQEDSS